MNKLKLCSKCQDDLRRGKTKSIAIRCHECERLNAKPKLDEYGEPEK